VRAGVLVVEKRKYCRFTERNNQMKKTVLTIAILSLAMVTVANNHLRLVHGYTFQAAESLSSDPQKARGDELTEEFHQTYPLSPTGLVSIANINGDVHISAWDQNEVKVDAVKRAYQRERLTEVTIDVVNTADSVRIKTKYPEHNSSSSDRTRENSFSSVEYTVRIPRKARVEGAELVNGSLDIEGVEGDVHASLVNGKVSASGLAGEVKLSTVNGSVEANVARLDDTKGISLNSVNGSIVLTVPASASAQVKANTLHGAITNDFGIEVHNGDFVGHDLDGQIGSGGPRIRLSNVNGPITIKRG
jgi:DUF4097 and DUF4098 domain-containing protein YvlB